MATKAKARDKTDADTAAKQPTDLARYYNRELSWLQFNRRVLEEAQNRNHPLMERLRFLSISASNLDEFYMVRAAGIYGQVAAGVTTPSLDGITPKEQLAQINAFVSSLVADKQACWNALKRELDAAGVHLMKPDQLTAEERAWLQQLFMTHVFLILTPIAIDPAHPFPFILNKGLTAVVWMHRESDGKTMSGLIPILGQLERFIRLRVGAQSPNDLRFIQLEQLISMFMGELFSGFDIKSQGAFRVIRDSDIELQEEAEDLVRSFETQLKRRRRGHVIRLELDLRMPETLRKFIIDELEVGDESVFVKDGLLALSDISQLIVSGSAGPAVQTVSATLPRAHPRVQRRLLRRDRQERHRRPSSLRASTWWCSTCVRPWPIPTSWRSSGRCTARHATARSCRRSRRRWKPASR